MPEEIQVLRVIERLSPRVLLVLDETLPEFEAHTTSGCGPVARLALLTLLFLSVPHPEVAQEVRDARESVNALCK